MQHNFSLFVAACCLLLASSVTALPTPDRDEGASDIINLTTAPTPETAFIPDLNDNESEHRKVWVNQSSFETAMYSLLT
jgi:hypothetical protein